MMTNFIYTLKYTNNIQQSHINKNKYIFILEKRKEEGDQSKSKFSLFSLVENNVKRKIKIQE